MNQADLLIKKLDAFIRKYYLNQIIRGLLLSVALLLISFLGMNFLEHQFYFSSNIRWILLAVWIGLWLYTFFQFLFRPVFGYFGLAKGMSYEEAARIIGRHFEPIQDKLLTVLQLKQDAEKSTSSLISMELLLASIEQKTTSIQPFEFVNAVDLKTNKKYLPYAAVPVLALLLLLVFVPNALLKPSARLFQPAVEFEKESPFHFNLLTKNLRVLQQNDLRIEVELSGEAFPDEVEINWDGQLYKMKKESVNRFSYTLSNLQKAASFRFEAGEFHSKMYEVQVVLRPQIIGFEVDLQYPAYTGRAPEVLRQTGDLNIPEGTRVTWKFNTQNTSQLQLILPDSSRLLANESNDFKVSTFARKAGAYQLFTANQDMLRADSVSYLMNVESDQYPVLQCEELSDSIKERQRYFYGKAEDDYGISKLQLAYQLHLASGAKNETWSYINIPYSGKNKISFQYAFDFNILGLSPGDRVDYYVITWDNDGIHGPKSARSELKQLKLASSDETEKAITDANKNLQKDLEKALKDAKAIRDQIKNMQEKLLQKKNLSFEDQKALENLQKQQKALEDKLSAMQKALEENKTRLDDLNALTPEMKEKLEALQEMMKDMKNENQAKDMQQLLDKMDQMTKDDVVRELKEKQQEGDQQQKQMDRMMSLYKQMQLDQQMQMAMEKLKEMADKQAELAKQSELAPQEKSADLKQQQDQLNKEYKEWMKQMESLKKQDEQLNNKMDLAKTESEQQDAQQDQQDASDQLQQKNNSSASKKQSSAAQKMKKMQQKMEEKSQSAESEQLEMDLRAIRQLLENLLQFSFEQEALMKQLSTMSINTPAYLQAMQQQRKLKDDAKLIEDSLYSLGKTVFQLKKYVTEQMTEVNKHQSRAMDYLEQRNSGAAQSEQQYIMTGANNLALMLNETMQNMQQQQSQQSKPGSGSCNKPGGSGQGKSGKKSAGQQLKDINQMSKEMRDALEKMMGKQGQPKPGEQPGQKPGAQKQGTAGGSGGQGQQEGQQKPGQSQLSSKEFAQLAAKQAALRKALQEFNQQYNKDGKQQYGNLDQLLKQMDLNETQLVNKRLTNEMLLRQKQIETRLLEVEDASREQDKDQKRESNTAQDQTPALPPAVLDYIKKRQAMMEGYQTVPPEFSPYYKQLVEDYFKAIRAGGQ